MSIGEKEIAARVQEEHEQLKNEMAKINRKLDAKVAPHEFADWQLGMLLLLRDFQNDLLKHFDLEELGGFMRDVMRLAPHHSHSVERLYDEHRRISAELEAVMIALKAATAIEIDVLDSIRSRISDLLALLIKHEETEGELLITTYLQDEGGGD